ncbi:hypothetical protein JQ594_36590 [Bradyrhizobium manausense]|uniref:hypothetical protein n=1 Tax=Bradyrhizobium manausense TaxID=989370 RepID=UPI001BA5C627|nr:hypothetical protein [Bradyrhizobium manausense]MBR0691481.1 hypothetical protein [Bradyrhizobium manausense]
MRGMASSYPGWPGPASGAGSVSVSCRFPPILSEGPDLFRPRAAHETKRGANETISGAGEDVLKLVMVINPANE